MVEDGSAALVELIELIAIVTGQCLDVLLDQLNRGFFLGGELGLVGQIVLEHGHGALVEALLLLGLRLWVKEEFELARPFNRAQLRKKCLALAFGSDKFLEQA